MDEPSPPLVIPVVSVEPPPKFDWNVFLIKLSSRKFIALLIAVLTSLTGLLQHQIDFSGFLVAVIASVVAYMAAEGLADSGNRA